MLTRALPVKQSPVSQKPSSARLVDPDPAFNFGPCTFDINIITRPGHLFHIFLVYKDSNPRVYSRPPPLMPGLEDKIEGQRLITTNCNDILSYRSTWSRMIIGGNVSGSYIERSHLYMQGASGVI